MTHVKNVIGTDLDVAVQDQTTPALIIKMNKITNETTLATAVEKFTYFLDVASITGISVGSYLIMFTATTNKFYKGSVVAIVGNVLEMDTQLDSDFPIGSIINIGITNMNVNGAVTPQIFGVRGLATPENIAITFDITRIIITCLATSAVDLSKFGDLTKLTRGIALRKRNGNTINIFTAKSNVELEGLTLDWKPFAATNPAQGQDGFSCRLTFAGQDKLGIVQRLAPGEDLEMIIQDNLTGLIFLEVVAEGHEVIY